MSSANEPSSPSGLVALTAGGPHAWITINALREAYGEVTVILEEGEPGGVFWRRRLKRLGPLIVAGQWGQMLLAKATKPLSRARVPELVSQYDLQAEPAPDQLILRVASVNSKACRETLRAMMPRAVYVVGTRMISAETLQSIPAPFINYHSGITPGYRGIHGGYHALARGEPQHFGATLHLVDAGIDTGDILAQVQVTPEKGDNFHTYLWLMAAQSRQAVVSVMGQALNGQLRPYRRDDMADGLYFGPTLWSYLWAGLRRGVW